MSAYNITCNTVGVTFIKTDMLEKFPPDQIEAAVKALPIPRYATADDICHVIDFFASEKSGYITAQTLFRGGIHSADVSIRAGRWSPSGRASATPQSCNRLTNYSGENVPCQPQFVDTQAFINWLTAPRGGHALCDSAHGPSTS
jgi:hypothetical protein